MDSGLSLRANVLWNSAGSLTFLGCQWLITVLVVRLTGGYTEAGVLALAMAICNLFTPFARYQMRTYQVSDVTHEYTAGQYMGFRLVTLALALVGCMAYAIVTCQSSAYLAILLYLLYKTVDLIIDVMHGVDQQHMRMDYIGKSQIARGILSLASFCIVIWLTHSLDWAIASMIIVSLPVCFFYDLPKASSFEGLRPSLSGKLVRDLLIRCLPAVAAAIFSSAVLTVPRQYLALEFGDALLGIYSSVAAPVAIVQMGASYVYSPLLGPFAEAYANGEKATFKSLLVKVIIGMLVVTVVCVIGFELVGSPLLVLMYGESIADYVYLLIPAMLCSILTAFLWFLSDLLVSMRDFKGNLIGNVVSLIFSIGSTFFFVQHFNMNGVNFTGLLALGAGTIVLFAYVIKHMKDMKVPQQKDGEDCGV